MTDSTSDRPALLGGSPLRSEPLPVWPPFDDAVRESLQTCIASGDWGRYEGASCEQLEQQWRQRTGYAHVQLCASGTAAVELALRGLGVSAGDEVILSAYDFKANLQNVLLLGAQPVLVDTIPDQWTVDLNRIESAITPSTKAIIASHLHGAIADMPALMSLAQSHQLMVIEDACQAPGAVVFERQAGSWGDVSVFSFGGSKLLSSGRGGAVCTPHDQVAQRMRLYTHRGNVAYPLSELQAAVVLGQLQQLEARNQHRLNNVRWLMELLSAGGGLTRPQDPADCTPAFYKVGLLYDPSAFGGLGRDVFCEAMRAEGIPLDPGFRALHRIHSKRRFRAPGELVAANRADESIVMLHHPILLEAERTMTQIANAVKKIRSNSQGLLRAGAGQQSGGQTS